ncbi:restriction endonuclease subunit S [Rickettsia conorii]
MCFVDDKMLPQIEVMVNEHVYIFRGKPNIIHQSYLFYCLNSDIIQNQIKNLAYNKSAQPGLNREHINSIYIPLPSLEKQQEIIEELNSYQKIIEGAKQIIDNWHPYFAINK